MTRRFPGISLPSTLRASAFLLLFGLTACEAPVSPTRVDDARPHAMLHDLDPPASAAHEAPAEASLPDGTKAAAAFQVLVPR